MTEKKYTKTKHPAARYSLLFVIIAFLVWGILFIYRSSSIGIDGERYFCLFDDAMISMRYAWNFSHGNGLVWNEGEHVQGFTNLLMVMLMSIACFFLNKKLAVLAIQILGMVFMFSIAYLSMKLSEEVLRSQSSLVAEQSNDGIENLQSIVVFWAVLSYYPLTYWSLMGMETGLLSVFLVFGLLFSLKYGRTLASLHILIATVSFGLAYLTRPDSIVFVFIVWIFIFLGLLKSPENRKFLIGGNFFYASILLSSIVVCGLLFQYLYYGHIFPNTYTLKLTQMPITDRVENGFGFLIPYLIYSSPVLLSAVALLFLKFRKENVLLLLLVLSAICYQIYVGGDPWRYWRIIAPVMPIALILAIGFTYLLIFQYISNRDHFYTKHVLAFVLVFLMLVSVDWQFRNEIIFASQAYQVASNHRNIDTAIAINEVTYDSASIGVFWAGTIPYYCDRKAIDFLGKSDTHIASLAPDRTGNVSWSGMDSVPGHNKYDLIYSIITLQPTYAQGLVWGGQNLSALAGTMYKHVEYRGVNLILKQGSNDVKWGSIYP